MVHYATLYTMFCEVCVLFSWANAYITCDRLKTMTAPMIKRRMLEAPAIVLILHVRGADDVPLGSAIAVAALHIPYTHVIHEDWSWI